jgi:hypothetical protein
MQWGCSGKRRQDLQVSFCPFDPNWEDLGANPALVSVRGGSASVNTPQCHCVADVILEVI